MPQHRPVIAVFGSSRPGDGSAEYALARDLGRRLAEAGFRVCNGGYGGTMEASARGAKEGGGSTLGIVTEFFSPVANRYIDETLVTGTLADRLLKLIELGDAYVVLPGSTGTLLELATAWEFMNKGVVSPKPIIVVGTFWKNVVETLREGLVREGRSAAAAFVTMAETPAECAAALRRLLGPS